MATDGYFDLGLPQLPLNTDPKIEPDMRDIFNAIRNLARYVQQIADVSLLAPYIMLPKYALASAPSPVGLPGAKVMITDASTTLTLGIGTAIVGGGANKVPAYSDGVNWIYG